MKHFQTKLTFNISRDLFSRAIKLTGPFVTMIFSMITGDMFTFSIIYIIILFGFSQAFYTLQKSAKNPGQYYKGYHTTWVGMFHMTLGEYSVNQLKYHVIQNINSLSFII